MTAVSKTLYEARLTLCELMDTCDGCTLPPNFGNVPNAGTIRQNWCNGNCHVPGQLKAQEAKIEDMQRVDRKARRLQRVKKKRRIVKPSATATP
ncbi:MAG: hypothetical protein JWN30_852 [Bacilli bacterium]|nr:hypothetical protein [Bacilli bacterium]